jgi:protein-tyrosine phosphatase
MLLLQHSPPDPVFSEEGFAIFIGSAAHAANSKVLAQYNIKYVLNVSDRIRFKRVDDGLSVVQYHVPLSDYGDSPLHSVLDECFSIINEARANHCNILVHCQRGVNRSPTIVIAYLMHTYNWSLKKAWEHVREKRTMASPHEHYMQQLIDYEIELFGHSTLDFEEYSQNSIQAQLRKIRLQYSQQTTTNEDSSSLLTAPQTTQTSQTSQISVQIETAPQHTETIPEPKKPPQQSLSTLIPPLALLSPSSPSRSLTPPPTLSSPTQSPEKHSPQYQWSPPSSPKFLARFDKDEKLGFDCILCEGNAFS